eukprot:SAG31_NODE_8051_length_1532_cov_14.647592_1_plen_251_part_10
MRSAGQPTGQHASSSVGIPIKQKTGQAAAKAAKKAAKAQASRTVTSASKADEYSIADKLRSLCVKTPGCAIHAKYSEDGRFYAATLDGVVGTRFLVTYTEYGEAETVAPADINCDEAWLLYEYSPGFVPPSILNIDHDNCEGDGDHTGGALPSSNAEWRQSRQPVRDALEKELIRTKSLHHDVKVESRSSSVMAHADDDGFPVLTKEAEDALEANFLEAHPLPASFRIQPPPLLSLVCSSTVVHSQMLAAL